VEAYTQQGIAAQLAQVSEAIAQAHTLQRAAASELQARWLLTLIVAISSVLAMTHYCPSAPACPTFLDPLTHDIAAAARVALPDCA